MPWKHISRFHFLIFDTDMRVIFLHHAGGDKYSWRRYSEALSPQIDQVYVELPGRGDRFSEPLLSSTDEMVDDIYQQIKDLLDQPYILVGKSMGALHTYLLLYKISSFGKSLPIHVFLGSRKCPASYHHHVKIGTLNSNDFWEGVKGYGGCPPALLQHKELMELYEPILRADFQSLESYSHQEKNSLPVNVTIMVGKEDQIKLEDTLSWKNHFEGEVDFIELLGGHFFMHEQAFTISKMIEDKFVNMELALNSEEGINSHL